MEQRTDEWFESRLGKATASRIADIIAKTKTGPSASRENYAVQLVLERITQSKGESYTNAAMQWGTETEPMARQQYELKRGVFVDEVGFIDHPTIAMSGASPDGLVGADGLVEIKCPNTLTMIETLLSQKVPGKYFAQMQFQMACTGRKWTDYVVFDPRMPEKAQLFVKRVDRDDAYIAEIEAEIVKFLAEVKSQVQLLNNYIESQP